MNRSTLDLRGIIPPMITPLTTDGAIDEAGIQRLVDYMISGGVSGIFVLGSSGEGPWFTDAQRQHVIASTHRAAAGRVPVLAGVIEPSSVRTIEAVKQAEAAGADAVVVAAPYYFIADAQAQLAHFEAVANNSPLPIILYNIPSMTHNPIAPETVREALQFEPVIALKDSAGDLDIFKQYLEQRQYSDDFRVFQGTERYVADSLLMGADGAVPGLGNIVPRIFVEIFDLAQANDAEGAQALQARINTLGDVHSYSVWIEGLKFAAAQLGFGSGTCVSRKPTLTAEGIAAIQALLKEAGL